MSNTVPNLPHPHPTSQGPRTIDLSTRAKFKLTGNDRLRYLNGQTTNDLLSLPVGSACRAAVLDAKGRFQAEIMVAKAPDALWIDAPAILRFPLAARLERYIVADDVTLEDVTDLWHLLHLRSSPAPEGTSSFRSPRYLEPGTDLWLPLGSTLPPDICPESDAEPLRILRLLPAWDREINTSTLVPEVLYDRVATSYTKGCYLGQEIVARLKSIGRVNRELRLLRASTPPDTQPPFPLQHNGQPAGHLTSLAPHPSEPCFIGLALLPRAFLLPGTQLTGGSTTWEVQPLPDFDISASAG